MGEEVEIYVKDNVDIVGLIDEDISSYKYELEINEVKLPLNIDDQVGVLVVEDLEGKKLYFPLIVKQKVAKKNFFKVWWSNIVKWIS